MKKRVFDIPTWWEFMIKEYGVEQALEFWKNNITLECALYHGKEQDGFTDAVCKVIDVPLEFEGHVLQVGNCFISEKYVLYDTKCYWKIKEINDDYFKADHYINGVLDFKSEDKWHPKHIAKLIVEPKPEVKELTVAQVSELLGYDVKIVK